MLPDAEDLPAQARTANDKSVVPAEELSRAAVFARLSGLCYLPEAELEAALADEGLRLIAAGYTHFTRYGLRLEVMPLCTTRHSK